MRVYTFQNIFFMSAKQILTRQSATVDSTCTLLTSKISVEMIERSRV